MFMGREGWNGIRAEVVEAANPEECTVCAVDTFCAMPRSIVLEMGKDGSTIGKP